jgi:hypothetical protein
MHMKPTAVDLFCGLGGWTEGLLAEGYKVVGFDIEEHVYGEHKYPGKLILADVLTLHGSLFARADLIVASPPCQEYSYMAMPWSRAKAKAAAIRADTTGAEMERLTRLFRSCFRIQREACVAAGRHIPMVVENVRGAQPWVGKAQGNFGSFYLWGDVPPLPKAVKAVKVGGKGSWADFHKPDYVAHGMNRTAEARLRGEKGVGPKWDPDGRKAEGLKLRDQDGYERTHPNAFGWKSPRTSSGAVSARKFASAMIAKIPLVLSRHIAVTFKPPMAQAAE